MPQKPHAAAWASDAPTPAQLAEFFRQVQAGRITGTSFQDFLRGGTPLHAPEEAPAAPDVSRERRRELLRFWEEKLPGSGIDIAACLRPFYSPDVSFELAPPAPDLEEWYGEAVFWNDVSAVVPITVDLPLGTFHESRLGSKLWDELRARLGSDAFALLQTSLWESLSGHLAECLGRCSWVCTDDALWEMLWDVLWESLFTAAGFELVGEREMDFQPFLHCWFSGNLPLGFAKRNQFLVLCGSARP